MVIDGSQFHASSHLVFQFNTATTAGGSIVVHNATISLENSVFFTGNNASYLGGAIYLAQGGEFVGGDDWLFTHNLVYFTTPYYEQDGQEPPNPPVPWSLGVGGAVSIKDVGTTMTLGSNIRFESNEALGAGKFCVCVHR